MLKKGFKHSQETKDKIRSKAFGRKHKSATIAKIKNNATKYWLGKKRIMSDSWRRNITIANQKHRGDKHPNWTGGGHKFWTHTALIRDDYTCQLCGLREPEIMEVDHIKRRVDFPKLEKELSNLITLCPNCHARKTRKERRLKRAIK